MIKNDQEYKFTQELAAEFEKSLAAIKSDESHPIGDSNGQELIRGALPCHLDKLKGELAEYDRLISHDRHQPLLLKLDALRNLTQLLVKARIAAKLSQKELADLAGLTEEKIGDSEVKRDYVGRR
jgi:hypothetical protein